MTPHFWSSNNFYAIIGNIPAMAIVCLGLMYVVLIGDLDLSLGSILGFTAILAVFFFKVMHFPLWLNLISCVFVGGLFGALNGVIVTKIGINSIITILFDNINSNLLIIYLQHYILNINIATIIIYQ